MKTSKEIYKEIVKLLDLEDRKIRRLQITFELNDVAVIEIEEIIP